MPPYVHPAGGNRLARRRRARRRWTPHAPDPRARRRRARARAPRCGCPRRRPRPTWRACCVSGVGDAVRRCSTATERTTRRESPPSAARHGRGRGHGAHGRASPNRRCDHAGAGHRARRAHGPRAAEGDRARRRGDTCRWRRRAASSGSTPRAAPASWRHWRGIVIAACEQCGRARVPEVAEPVTLATHLAAPTRAARRLLLARKRTPSLAAEAAGAGSIELLVGPEGGLDDGEREAAFAAGYRRLPAGAADPAQRDRGDRGAGGAAGGGGRSLGGDAHLHVHGLQARLARGGAAPLR